MRRAKLVQYLRRLTLGLRFFISGWSCWSSKFQQLKTVTVWARFFDKWYGELLQNDAFLMLHW